MNLAALSFLQQYPKLLGLKDMLGLKANQLTNAHLTRVADALEVELPFHEELLNAFVALLKGKDINEVADLIKSPESVGDLVIFLKGGYRELVEAKAPEPEPYPPEASLLFIGNNNG